MPQPPSPTPPSASPRQLPLALGPAPPPTAPPAPGGPSLRPRAIWATLTPAQQAQVCQAVRRIRQALLRADGDDGRAW